MKNRWLVLFSVCATAFFSGCCPQKQAKDAALVSKSGKKVVVRIFSGYYPDEKKMLAIVDPFVLEAEHFWKCEADLGGSYYGINVERTEGGEVRVAAGFGSGESLTVFEGPLIMDEKAPFLSVVSPDEIFSQIAFSAISGEKEAALIKRAKEKNAGLIPCVIAESHEPDTMPFDP